VELRAGMDKWVGGWLEGLRWAEGYDGLGSSSA